MIHTIAFLGLVLGQDPASYREPEYTREDRQHWSFQKPKRPPVPAGEKNPIDALIRAKLKEKQIAHSPEADRRTLIRRVTYDLIGLPPTPDEVEKFLADSSPNAYETVVDRLLASPHFGERQAQHWLDLVRFAESNGYELDADRPNAWRYRDYVVNAFNADKPYDQFAKEQIAGDERAAGKEAIMVAELQIATGFHRCGPVHVVSGNLDAKVVRQEVLTEMVTGVSSAFLGLTMGCARCHDHKFDPISQGDYYRFEAFFAGTQFREIELATEAEQNAIKEKIAKLKKETDPLRKKIGAIDAPIKARLRAQKVATLDEKSKVAVNAPAITRTAEQKKLFKEADGIITVRWDEVLEALSPEQKKARSQLREQIFAIERGLPADPAGAWAVGNEEKRPDTFVLKRGDVKKQSIKVEPETPRVVSHAGKVAKSRTDLAAWITQVDNPLTARVVVNRLWHQHFGRGIVNTPNDFGTRGGRPTHPELLDWLACELANPSNEGKAWSLKRIHRLMVTSATYRQVSDTTPREAAKLSDPDNLLLWRMNRRRLDAESIRDGMLAAAGSLNRKLSGPSIRVPLESEVYDLIFTEDEPDHLWRVTDDTTEYSRRSIYLYAKRNVRYPMLEAFDQPDAINSCSARGVSTFAPQALIMMNGPFAHETATTMAKGLNAKGKDWIVELFQKALSRKPTERELNFTVQFYESQWIIIRGEKPKWTENEVRLSAMTDVCLAIFNSSEFAYIP